MKSAISGVKIDIRDKYTPVKNDAQKTYRGITNDVKKALAKVQGIFK